MEASGDGLVSVFRVEACLNGRWLRGGRGKRLADVVELAEGIRVFLEVRESGSGTVCHELGEAIVVALGEGFDNEGEEAIVSIYPKVVKLGVVAGLENVADGVLLVGSA